MEQVDLELYKPIGVEEITDQWEQWVTNEQRMVLQRNDWVHSIRGYDISSRFIAVQVPKRGNDAYCRRIRNRINTFTNCLPDFDFFDPFAPQEELKKCSTEMLYIVLTYRRDISFEKAWEDLGKDVNKYLSRIKKHYGQIRHIRSWETHKDGWPHVNLVIWFKERSLGIAYSNRRGRGLPDVRINRVDRDKLKEYWTMGYSDIQACYSIQESVRYATKYITKAITPASRVGGKKDPSRSLFALTWYHKKRLFSFSKDFTTTRYSAKQYSNQKSRLVQFNLNNEPIETRKWVFRGIYPSKLFPFEGKPPPEIDLGTKLPDNVREYYQDYY